MRDRTIQSRRNGSVFICAGCVGGALSNMAPSAWRPTQKPSPAVSVSQRAADLLLKKGLPRAPEYRPSLSRNRSSVRRDSLISDHRSTAMEYSTTRLFPSAALTHVSNVAAPVVPLLSDPICLQVHAP